MSNSIKSIVELYKATTLAIRSEVQTSGKWDAINLAVPVIYKDLSAYENDRTSFMVNGIAPGFYSPAEIKLLAGKFDGTWDVPSPTSARYKEAKAKGGTECAAWDTAREAVRKMEITCATRWSRIKAKGFPKGTEGTEGTESEETEGTEASSPEHMKLVEGHAKQMKRAQKSNQADCNITEYLRLMTLAQTVLTTPLKK